MGAFCCCPCGEELEEYTHPSGSIYRHCICLRYFLYQLFCGYSAIFQRLEGRAVASPIQGATPVASAGLGTASPDSSFSVSDTYQLVPRPVPYDADPRYSRVQRDGLVSRREKAQNHFQDESQPLRRSSSSSGVEPLGEGKKWSGVDSDEECKSGLLESSETAKSLHGVEYTVSAEDEDVCPTCLDEYTLENPKIMTQCSHHFHLSCIYEWMERSENCPLCGKEMEF